MRRLGTLGIMIVVERLGALEVMIVVGRRGDCGWPQQNWGLSKKRTEKSQSGMVAGC